MSGEDKVACVSYLTNEMRQTLGAWAAVAPALSHGSASLPQALYRQTFKLTCLFSERQLEQSGEPLLLDPDRQLSVGPSKEPVLLKHAYS